VRLTDRFEGPVGAANMKPVVFQCTHASGEMAALGSKFCRLKQPCICSLGYLTNIYIHRRQCASVFVPTQSRIDYLCSVGSLLLSPFSWRYLKPVSGTHQMMQSRHSIHSFNIVGHNNIDRSSLSRSIHICGAVQQYRRVFNISVCLG
jgi:hypothetical protein